MKKSFFAALILWIAAVPAPGLSSPCPALFTQAALLEDFVSVQIEKRDGVSYLDGLPIRSIDAIPGAINGIDNRGIYFHSAVDGSAQVMKLVRTWRDLLNEMENALWVRATLHRGPELARIGVALTIDGRSKDTQLPFLDFTELFSDRPGRTSLKALSERIRKTENHDLWSILTRGGLRESHARKMVHFLVECLERGMMPMDPDFIFDGDALEPFDFGRYFRLKTTSPERVVRGFARLVDEMMSYWIGRPYGGQEVSRLFILSVFAELADPSSGDRSFREKLLVEFATEIALAAESPSGGAYEEWFKLVPELRTLGYYGIQEWAADLATVPR